MGRNMKFNRSRTGGSGSDMRESTDLEDAAYAMNRINLRTRIERQKLRDEKRAKPSMPKMPWEDK